MAEINCPMCGRPNPEELDVCQFCEAQLRSVTDQLSRSQPPIKPGEDPKKVDTGELEPVLPQWLRDVRQQAREAAEDAEEPEQTGSLDKSAAGWNRGENGSPPDLLAGLASQSEEEEEVPDWLANIRESDTSQSDMPDMMADLQEDTEIPKTGELGGVSLNILNYGEDETDATSPEQDLPAEFGSFDAPLPDSIDEASQTDAGEIPDWLKSMGVEGGPKDDELKPATPHAEEAAETTSGEPAEFAGEETPVPDWLSSLGGAGTDTAETSLPTEEPVQPGGEEAQTPDWLSSLRSEDTAEMETQFPAEEPAQPSGEEAQTPDWLSSLRNDDTAEMETQFPAEEPAQPSGDDGQTPDWLSNLGGEDTAEMATSLPAEESVQPGGEEAQTPDWLSNLGGEDTAEMAISLPAEEPVQPGGEEAQTPDWLSNLGSEDTAEMETQFPAEEPVQTGGEEAQTPDWFSNLGGEDTDEMETSLPAEESVQPGGEEAQTPDWLSNLGGEDTAEMETSLPAEEPVQPGAEEAQTPDWLTSPGEEDTAETEIAPEPEKSLKPSVEGEIPDWLGTLDGESQAEEGIPEPEEQPFGEEAGQPEIEEEQPAASIKDESTPISSGDMDDIFSMEMPDWLEDVGGKGQATEAETSEETAFSEELSPASLPTWVQAMRPVESVISETVDSDEPEDFEESGPFAGLRGVLPPVPDFSPTSKPKTYTLKLDANEEQQENAALLDRLITNETHPLPIKSQAQILSQRMLRWVITILMLILISGVVFSGTEIIPMPIGMPREAWAAVQVIEGIPENAPVLLIFDYEAARAGEMEASAAGLIDHMLLLKHPRLALLASRPTGVGLAGRFMATTQSGHNYQDGQQMLNLGYLPGGAAGVLGFAKAPQKTVPIAANGFPAWESPALQGVDSVSDFAAVILLSDDGENARIWIEQLDTDNSLGNTSFIVVSSGQSGPMILPYVQSGQVDGMVTGLDNDASIEQYNAGRPGLARGYWDAYGFGLLVAIAVIVLGTIWNLVAGRRASSVQTNGEG